MLKEFVEIEFTCLYSPFVNVTNSTEISKSGGTQSTVSSGQFEFIAEFYNDRHFDQLKNSFILDQFMYLGIRPSVEITGNVSNSKISKDYLSNLKPEFLHKIL